MSSENSNTRIYSAPEYIQHPENRIRPITIKEVDRGYIVTVGCLTLAISTKEELTFLLMEYINEPSTTEQKYHNGLLF